MIGYICVYMEEHLLLYIGYMHYRHEHLHPSVSIRACALSNLRKTHFAEAQQWGGRLVLTARINMYIIIILGEGRGGGGGGGAQALYLGS